MSAGKASGNKLGTGFALAAGLLAAAPGTAASGGEVAIANQAEGGQALVLTLEEPTANGEGVLVRFQDTLDNRKKTLQAHLAGWADAVTLVPGETVVVTVESLLPSGPMPPSRTLRLLEPGRQDPCRVTILAADDGAAIGEVVLPPQGGFEQVDGELLMFWGEDLG